jgi:hypothetical protein
MRTLTAAMCVCAILAGPVQAETASWYAAHPDQMNARITACMDDPGHGRSDPECANATQGRANLEVAQAYARLAAETAAMNRQQEAAWRADPQALSLRLRICTVSPPDARPAWDCDAAEAIAREQRHP